MRSSYGGLITSLLSNTSPLDLFHFQSCSLQPQPTLPWLTWVTLQFHTAPSGDTKDFILLSTRMQYPSPTRRDTLRCVKSVEFCFKISADTLKRQDHWDLDWSVVWYHHDITLDSCIEHYIGERSFDNTKKRHQLSITPDQTHICPLHIMWLKFHIWGDNRVSFIHWRRPKDVVETSEKLVSEPWSLNFFCSQKSRMNFHIQKQIKICKTVQTGSYDLLLLNLYLFLQT